MVYDASCPSEHTDVYCSGYNRGYNNMWDQLNGRGNDNNGGTYFSGPSQSQAQTQTINIHNNINVRQSQAQTQSSGEGIVHIPHD